MASFFCLLPLALLPFLPLFDFFLLRYRLLMSDDRRPFHTALNDALRPFAFPLTDRQCDLLWRHFAAVCEANTRFNLTRITAPAAGAVKHDADSLMLAVWARDHVNKVQTILDVGTGPGFPAVPVAVVRPDWQVTAIDSTAKKTAFLAAWITAAQVPNLTALHARAEHWSQHQRFDVVAFRATGSLTKCLLQARGVVAPKGLVVCYKTRVLPTAESAEAGRAAKSLGFHPEPSFEYDLVCGEETLMRQLVVYRLG